MRAMALTLLLGGLISLEALGVPAPKIPFKPQRFLDHGDYIEDTQTGIFWQKDGAASGKLNFYQAADYAKQLRLGGMEGWRVPTKEELAAIFPATDKPFINSKYTEAPCCKGPFEWNSYWTSDLDQ